jgi:oxygen-dependent protoporphyrinogen oxidase
MPAHAQVLIIGAGISGLVCTHALRKSGIDAQIVESSSHPGGVIRSEQRDGYLLELGPQSFSATALLLDLCRNLRIENELIEAPPRAPRFLLLEGRLKQVPLSPPAFLASSLFSTHTKWTILRDILGRTTPPDADESVADFVRRKFTQELLDKLAGPLVSGIYAGDPEKLSLRAAFPQLHEAERATGSVIRGMIRAAKSKPGPKQRPTLQSFKNGNETLIKALAANLGSALRLGVAITKIQRTPAAASASYTVTLTAHGSSEEITADHLVIATPTNTAAALLRGAHPEIASTLAPVEYAPIAVVSLGYQLSDVGHSLDGFGFLVPRSEKLRTLGTVWNSSLVPNRATEGHALLTSFIGGATDPLAITLSPDELVSLVHKEIAPIMQIRHAPAFSNVTLYPRALPQYNLGHSERLASLQKLRAAHPGLWLTGNYVRGPAIGACIEQALDVANEIRTGVARSASPASSRIANGEL